MSIDCERVIFIHIEKGQPSMHAKHFVFRPQSKLYRQFIISFALSLLQLFGSNPFFFAPVIAQSTTEPEPTQIYLPLITFQVASKIPPPRPPIWDPRLDQRGAIFIPAQVTPGQGYWRLIKAVWFNQDESGGRHHIFVDTLNGSGTRQIDVPVLVSWTDDTAKIITQAKANEAYAADFAMFAIAPSYQARPDANAPADSVDGMGLGEIDDPAHGVHTSYGLTWQWTIASTPPEPTLTVTATPIITVTSTATATPTITMTPSPTVTVDFANS